MPGLDRATLLRELGIEQYRPRRRPVAATEAVVAVPAPASAPARLAPAAQPASPPALPQLPAARPVAAAQPAVPAAVPSAAGSRFTLCFQGPAGTWPGLRRHLLQAFEASEHGPGAEIVFGGRGSLLALPALGALAANPALKRQAWQALRALRRSRPA